MATGQATEAAKPGWLGNDGNAACRHFFPALKGRVAADAQHHTALAKPARLDGMPCLAGSSPRNAMSLVAMREIGA